MYKKAAISVVLLLMLFPVISVAAQTQVAVLEFVGKNVSTEEASALADRLRIELFRTGQFKVMEREIMDQILEEQGFQLSECTSNECIVEMGQLIGVERVVAGSVSRVGEVFSIAARMVSVQTGEIIGIATYDYEGKIGQLLKTGMANVSQQLAGTIQAEQQPEPVVEKQVVPPQPVSQPPQQQVTQQPVYTPPPQTQPQPQYQPAPTKAKKSRLGIMIGVNSAMITGGDVRDTVIPKAGFSTSVYMLYRLANGLAIRPELVYTQKGWTNEDNYDGLDYKTTANLNYIEIPFLIQLGSTGSRSGLGLYLIGGASAGFLLSSTYMMEVDGEEWDSGDMEDIDININSGESVLVLGGGLFFGKNLHTEMRLNVGLTPIEEDFDGNNFSIDLTIGIAF